MLVQIDAFNFLFIKKWLLLLLNRYFIFGLKMDILHIIKIQIYSFNCPILVNFFISLIFLYIVKPVIKVIMTSSLFDSGSI